jgi:CBS-domain-containing membrane protein
MEKRSVLERATEARGSLGAGLYAAVLCLVVLAASGVVGLLIHLPWLFPSLGPTVMLFFESPAQDAARPVNTIFGHSVALVVGVLCLYTFGLQNVEAAPAGGLTPMHLLAGPLSVALTTLVLTWAKMPHPPAGATTLTVSLGILTSPAQLASMAGAIIFITALGWGLNILFGTRPSKRGQV